MTSLIDVIFLLLLFFMLSSTFSKFAEVEISGGGAVAAAATGVAPLFLLLEPEALSLNGVPLEIGALSPEIGALVGEATTPLLVSLRGDVTAQRLTDLLVALRAVEGIAVSVLTPR